MSKSTAEEKQHEKRPSSHFHLSLTEDLDWLGKRCPKQLPLIPQLEVPVPQHIKLLKYNPRLDPEAPQNRYYCWRSLISTTRELPELIHPKFKWERGSITRIAKRNITMRELEEEMENAEYPEKEKPADEDEPPRRTLESFSREREILRKLSASIKAAPVPFATPEKQTEEVQVHKVNLYKNQKEEEEEEEKKAKHKSKFPEIETFLTESQLEKEKETIRASKTEMLLQEDNARLLYKIKSELSFPSDYNSEAAELLTNAFSDTEKELYSIKSRRKRKNIVNKRKNRIKVLYEREINENIGNIPKKTVSDTRTNKSDNKTIDTRKYKSEERLNTADEKEHETDKASETDEESVKETKRGGKMESLKQDFDKDLGKTKNAKDIDIKTLIKTSTLHTPRPKPSLPDVSDDFIDSICAASGGKIGFEGIEILDELKESLKTDVIEIEGDRVHILKLNTPDSGPSQIPVDQSPNLDKKLPEDENTFDFNIVTPETFDRLMPPNWDNVAFADIAEGIKNAAKQAFDYLEKNIKMEVKTHDMILKVTKSFSKGDYWTARKLADAYEMYGGKTECFVCKGKKIPFNAGDSFYIKNGYILRPGFKSPCILDGIDQTRYTRPIIIIVHAGLSNFNILKPLIEDLKKTDRSLILIVQSITLNLLRLIHHQNLAVLPRNNQIIVATFPDKFISNRALVEDFGLLLGTKVCSIDDLYYGRWDSTIHFGSAADVIVTKEEICFLITKGRVKILKAIAEGYNKSLKSVGSKDDRARIKDRMRILLSKVCVFETGRQWRDATKRVEFLKEAIRKTDLAVKHGVVPGAGNSLIKCTDFTKIPTIKEGERLGYSIFQQEVMVHFAKYVESAPINPNEIAEKIRNLSSTFGYDPKTNQYCDLIENGVIEPLTSVKNELFQLYKRAVFMFTSNKKLKKTKRM